MTRLQLHNKYWTRWLILIVICRQMCPSLFLCMVLYVIQLSYITYVIAYYLWRRRLPASSISGPQMRQTLRLPGIWRSSKAAYVNNALAGTTCPQEAPVDGGGTKRAGQYCKSWGLSVDLTTRDDCTRVDLPQRTKISLQPLCPASPDHFRSQKVHCLPGQGGDGCQRPNPCPICEACNKPGHTTADRGEVFEPAHLLQCRQQQQQDGH